MKLTSLQNSRIKEIRALSQRRKRQQTGLFFVEGLRLVGEALQTRAEIKTLVVAPELLHSVFGRQLVSQAGDDGVETLKVSSTIFQHLSKKDGPQGIGAVVRQRWTALEEVKPDEKLGWIVLEEVGDPGNLGTILRTGDAVGAAGVILLGDTVDPYNPASVRGSMGSIFSQHLVRTSFEALVQWKQASDVPMIGTSDAASIDYHKANYTPPLLLCLGGEQHGLSEAHLKACDMVMRIPMVGRADSLNVAVATSVILYEAYNRMRA